MLLREGAARLLDDAGFDVVGQAGDGEDLLRKVRAHKPDVAVVDIRMPPTHIDEGLQAAKIIRSELPDIGVLVLSQYVEERYAVELLADGAEGVGYLLKDRIADGRPLRRGGAARRRRRLGARPRGRGPHARPARSATTRSTTLTPREREVLGLMAEGRTNRAIAGELVRVRARGRAPRDGDLRQARAVRRRPDDHRRVLAVLAFLRG